MPNNILQPFIIECVTIKQHIIENDKSANIQKNAKLIVFVRYRTFDYIREEFCEYWRIKIR